ncbi:MAG: hypothetical protein IPK16_31880 [Anaerolineales bacterium]|nr:hypothetical protein [Anaerolineales bacterium]
MIPSIIPPPATDTPTPTLTPKGSTPTPTPTITGTPPTLTPTATTQGQGDNCIGDVPECIFMPQLKNNPAQ